MLRLSLCAALVQLVLSAGAFACEGQKGKVIFEENFSDDSGGWDLNASNRVITPPDFHIVLNKDNSAFSVQNLTFNAIDGDYCAEMKFPKSVPAKVVAQIGIVFWAADYDNYMLFLVNSEGKAAAYRKSAGKWSTIFNLPNIAAIKTGPEASNDLQVIVKDGKIFSFVNGAMVKVFRAQTPTGAMRFGVFTGADPDVTDDLEFTVQVFRVTAGQ